MQNAFSRFLATPKINPYIKKNNNNQTNEKLLTYYLDEMSLCDV